MEDKQISSLTHDAMMQVLAEMVNLHFLSLMEALLECRSTILAKLMPLWCPVLHAYNTTVGVLECQPQS